MDIKQLKDANGKPVSLDGLDDKVVTVLGAIGAAVTAEIAQVTEGLGETVKDAVAESLKPISEEVAALKENKPATNKEGDPPVKDEMPAWAKVIKDSLESLTTERTQEREQAQVSARVRAYLDKYVPNLGDARSLVEARLLAAKPKDEAAIKSAVRGIRDEYKAIAGDAAVKKFDANPESEGAENGAAGDDPKAQAQKKIELIRKSGPPVKIAS